MRRHFARTELPPSRRPTPKCPTHPCPGPLQTAPLRLVAEIAPHPPGQQVCYLPPDCASSPPLTDEIGPLCSRLRRRQPCREQRIQLGVRAIFGSTPSSSSPGDNSGKIDYNPHGCRNWK